MAEILRKDARTALHEKPGAEQSESRTLGANVVEDGRYMPPPTDEDGKQWVRTSVLIKGEPRDLYGLWHNVEDAPLWQEQIASVTRTGEKTSHWTMQSATGTLEWDSEIMADEPGHRISWRSIGGDSENAGEVVFEAAPGGRGTYVTVLQEFRMGKLASGFETLTGRNPKQAVIENLRHFKALAETGEIPRTHGQPHGPRGAAGTVKSAAYAENVAQPPGLERMAS
ncbi:MAG: SRPBCC family protein [Acidobacteriota bacterium]